MFGNSMREKDLIVVSFIYKIRRDLQVICEQEDSWNHLEAPNDIYTQPRSELSCENNRMKIPQDFKDLQKVPQPMIGLTQAGNRV